MKNPFELSSLNGTNGFIINGIAEEDYSGVSVSGAYDLNGDGINDLVIGAAGASPNSTRNYAGQSYVVFGKKDNFLSPFELLSLNGANGFIINGIAAGDRSGGFVSGVYDLNGDEVSDIIIGALKASPNSTRSNAGQSYVIFGKSSSSFPSPFELSSLNGANGFIINGLKANDYAGGAAVSGSDINGDKISDLIIGAPNASPDVTRNNAGQSYVIFGKSDSFASPFELSSLNGANGFIINGITEGDGSGLSVSGGCDINGDNVNDLIIGAVGASPGSKINAGQSYVIFGKSSSFPSPFELSSLNGTNGFIINGIAEGDGSGISVSCTYDINGDSISDLIIGASGANVGSESKAGQSYVIFGKSSSFPSPFELSSLNGANGFIINGIATEDYCGASVSSASDINGDNINDLIIGAPGSDPNSKKSAGQSYVIFGKNSGSFASPFELSSLNGINGVTINGIIAADQSGQSVSSVDINSDGINDLIIGAFTASPNSKERAGQSYVIFGNKSPGIDVESNLSGQSFLNHIEALD